MKQKSKGKSGDYVFMFQREVEYYVKSQEILKSANLSPDELRNNYRQLSGMYNKLLKETMKLTRIGDMHYKKLMKANTQIEEQRNTLEVLNRQLQQANATKDKFFSIIAHDLRNPLQFLLFASEILDDEYEYGKPGAESIKKYIAEVLKTANNMSHLLENLLQWARSQSGRLECRPVPIDIDILARESIDFQQENSQNKDIEITQSVPENTLVYADENMIKSVFRNLVSNAVKFTPPGGAVSISASQSGDTVITAIKDTGVGIQQKRLASLFDIGESNSTAGTAKEKGTGLGLILCKEFIEKNGGQLQVSSCVGEGSTFEVSLPRVK